MKITMYVLHGMWHTQYTDQSAVIGISVDEEVLIRQLRGIADNKAKGFVEMCGYIQEKKDERNYEATNGCGKHAEFHITKHQVELPKEVMRNIAREMERIYSASDAETYLYALHNSGDIKSWQCEYMTRKPEVMQEILNVFEEADDSNVAYNETMAYAVKSVADWITLDAEKLEFLREEFKKLPADDSGCILENFLGFKGGTHREEIEDWFDKQ